MILPEVGKNPSDPDLCNRCAEAVEVLEARMSAPRYRTAGRGRGPDRSTRSPSLSCSTSSASRTWHRAESVPVLPFFNLVMVWFPGISLVCFRR